MTLEITDKNDYILVEPSMGMDYWKILEALPALFFLMLEFNDKDDIWVFRGGQMKILYSDLYTIKDVAERLHSKESQGRKKTEKQEKRNLLKVTTLSILSPVFLIAGL